MLPAREIEGAWKVGNW